MVHFDPPPSILVCFHWLDRRFFAVPSYHWNSSIMPWLIFKAGSSLDSDLIELYQNSLKKISLEKLSIKIGFFGVKLDLLSWSTRQKQRIPLCILGMNFKPYCHCGMRCFCFVLQYAMKAYLRLDCSAPNRDLWNIQSSHIIFLIMF